ncbi:MAG: hypothetical protein K6F99_10050, partial [Lachnospiraceae bacterium]|nr:hypothetical protein [Lachnospiraceae bacterium]
MVRKLLKRIAVSFLAATLIVGNMMITVPVFADEDNDDVQYEEGDVQTEEAPEPEPEPEPAPEPEP